MQPIVVKSKLDLNTFYKLILNNTYNKPFGYFMIFLVLFLTGYCTINHQWGLNTPTMYLAFLVIFYGVLVPFASWFAAKKRMQLFPDMFDGSKVLTIDNDGVESVSSEGNSKLAWPYIKKVIEIKRAFVIYTQTNTFNYLPKDEFASAAEIGLFKEIVKNNHVKARFK